MSARWTEKEIDKLVSLRQFLAFWDRISDQLKLSEDACRVKFYERKNDPVCRSPGPKTAVALMASLSVMKEFEEFIGEKGPTHDAPKHVPILKNVPLYALSICAAMLLLTWWLA